MSQEPPPPQDVDQPVVSAEQLLAQVIANHFSGATVEEREGTQTVVLGDGLPTVGCRIDSVNEDRVCSAFIFLDLIGGALGPVGALVTASGYGPTPVEAVGTAGCNWACAFGPVLLTALGLPERIETENPQVSQYEAVVGGRRYRVTSSHLDRSVNTPV